VVTAGWSSSKRQKIISLSSSTIPPLSVKNYYLITVEISFFVFCVVPVLGCGVLECWVFILLGLLAGKPQDVDFFIF
jgi:hypothetical protein